MAEDNSNNSGAVPGTAEEPSGAQFSLQKLYLKDVSFESPGAPMIFQEQGEQQLQLNLAQRVQTLGTDTYEVLLTVTVTAKIGEKTLYLAEVQQAGVFGISGLDEAPGPGDAGVLLSIHSVPIRPAVRRRACDPWRFSRRCCCSRSTLISCMLTRLRKRQQEAQAAGQA